MAARMKEKLAGYFFFKINEAKCFVYVCLQLNKLQSNLQIEKIKLTSSFDKIFLSEGLYCAKPNKALVRGTILI